MHILQKSIFFGAIPWHFRAGNVTILSLATVIYSVDHLPFGPLEEDMIAPAETKGKIGQLV